MRHYLSALLRASARSYPVELTQTLSMPPPMGATAAKPTYAHGRLVLTLPKTTFDRNTGRIIPLPQESESLAPGRIWELI
jgi:hypothetical protein